MNRLKYISMILRQFYFVANENDRSMENKITKFISTTIEKFQYVESARINFLDLLDSLRSSVARLRSSSTSILFEEELKSDTRVTLHLPNSLRNEEYLNFRNDEDLLFPLTFIRSHLRNLYVRLLKEKFIITNSKDSIPNNRSHLYFGHILIECLIFLSNSSCIRLSILVASIVLLPWLRIQQLENFGSSLLWTLALNVSYLLDAFEKTRKYPMNDETDRYTDTIKHNCKGFYLTDEERKTIIQDNIEQEYQRLQNTSIENYVNSE